MLVVNIIPVLREAGALKSGFREKKTFYKSFQVEMSHFLTVIVYLRVKKPKDEDRNHEKVATFLGRTALLHFTISYESVAEK